MTTGTIEPVEDLDIEVCTDCLMLIANGETPEDNPDFNLLDEWDGWHLALNGDDYGFSWSKCDGCGSRLGGDRHSVVAMKVEVSS